MSYISVQADLEAGLAELRARDAALDRIAAAHGAPPLRLREGGFSGLVQILIGQQLSVAAASAILKKFHAQLADVTPQAVLALSDETLAQCGLSRPKRRYIRILAEAIMAGDLDLAALATQPADKVRASLTQLTGIGPWTAEIYLLSCLGHSDSFPSGDLALQESIRLIAKMETRPTAAEAEQYAEKWRPYRAIAARMLWQYYNAEGKGAGDISAVEIKRNRGQAK